MSAPLAPDSILDAGTMLLLEKLHILPPREPIGSGHFSSTFWKLPSPLYFALFEELALKLFNTFSDTDPLELLHTLYPNFDEEMLPDQEKRGHADALLVILFHTLFTQWPTHFWTFLDVLYCTAPRPYASSFTFTMDRCRKIFANRLGAEQLFPWLWAAFEEHQEQFSQSDWYQKEQEKEAFLRWQASKEVAARITMYRSNALDRTHKSGQ